MKQLLQQIHHRLLGKRILKRIEGDRSFQYRNIQLQLNPGVFHPGYFDSSKLLLECVEKNIQPNDVVLEVGAGSGIASLRSAQIGARVTAIDINPDAIEGLIKNAVKNGLSVNGIVSDLFQNARENYWDYILINPPFYPKNPQTKAESAWYCGEGFNYFENLFLQLKRQHVNKSVFMTLSDTSDLEKIKEIAGNQGFEFVEADRKKSFYEINYLFEIRTDTPAEPEQMIHQE